MMSTFDDLYCSTGESRIIVNKLIKAIINEKYFSWNQCLITEQLDFIPKIFLDWLSSKLLKSENNQFYINWNHKVYHHVSICWVVMVPLQIKQIKLNFIIVKTTSTRIEIFVANNNIIFVWQWLQIHISLGRCEWGLRKIISVSRSVMHMFIYNLHWNNVSAYLFLHKQIQCVYRKTLRLDFTLRKGGSSNTGCSWFCCSCDTYCISS